MSFIIKINGGSINGITIFPFIFIDDKTNMELINHEKIHIRQQIEMLVIPFYLWYGIEWLVRGANGNAYKNISFERESYTNEYNLKYLKNRKPYSWVKYLKKKL